MQNIKEEKDSARLSACVKETYVKPKTEVVKMELEQPVLTGSAPDYGNGGRWGF